MSVEWCRDCREIKWDGHRCDPGWLVWEPASGETEDDARVFYGMSAEKAVERWAEWSDSRGDYEIVGGGEGKVHVRMRGQDWDRAQDLRLPTEELIVEVYGESVPSYTARVVERRPLLPIRNDPESPEGSP